MSADPITRLVKKCPTPAVMLVVADPEDGGPENDNNNITGIPTPGEFPVVGAFSNAVDAELDGTAQAIFTITKAAYDTITSSVQADFTKCRVAGSTYSIDKVRKRFWMGQLNGYTFALAL